jgi:hypothetical protein
MHLALHGQMVKVKAQSAIAAAYKWLVGTPSGKGGEIAKYVLKCLAHRAECSEAPDNPTGTQYMVSPKLSDPACQPGAIIAPL